MTISNTSSDQSGGGQQIIASQSKSKSCRDLIDPLACDRGCADDAADPCNMAEFTFQPRRDMATGIWWQLDTLGELLNLIILIMNYGNN